MENEKITNIQDLVKLYMRIKAHIREIGLTIRDMEKDKL